MIELILSLFENAGNLTGRLRFFFGVIALFAVLFAVVDCGYHRIQKGTNLPGDIRSISIPVFRNDTYEAGIEVLLTDALKTQFIRSGFVVVTDTDKADAVVVGTIRSFSNSPIGFSDSQFAVEYRASVKMRIKIVAKNGNVLWEDNNASRTDEYRVSENIFQSEAEKKKAIERIARDLMADIHDRVFDGFYVAP